MSVNKTMKKEIKITYTKMESLDDMVRLFFHLAKSLGHPIKEIDVTLMQSFAEVKKDINKENAKDDGLQTQE